MLYLRIKLIQNLSTPAFIFNCPIFPDTFSVEKILNFTSESCIFRRKITAKLASSVIIFHTNFITVPLKDGPKKICIKLWKILNNGLFWNKLLIDYPKQRQVWYVHLWVNVWFEQDGKGNDYKRPVIILKVVWSMYVILPMTTTWKDSAYYFSLPYHYFNKPSWILLSQIRVIDRKRFIEKIWYISQDDFSLVKQKLTELIL